LQNGHFKRISIPDLSQPDPPKPGLSGVSGTDLEKTGI
jgi:hypothetical protein